MPLDTYFTIPIPIPTYSLPSDTGYRVARSSVDTGAHRIPTDIIVDTARSYCSMVPEVDTGYLIPMPLIMLNTDTGCS
jgi:hypothetical protein